jgi:hypothetical protein
MKLVPVEEIQVPRDGKRQGSEQFQAGNLAKDIRYRI